MTPRKRSSVTQEVDSILGPAPASYTQPEAIVLRFRRHGRRLAFPVLALVVLAVAAGYFVGGFTDPWANLAAGAGAAVLGLLLGILPILTWLASRTTVSTRRVIVRHGLVSRGRTELALTRVREVRTHRGPLQRMLGSGDVILLHGAESLRLEDVPGAQRVADALQELVERNFAHAERMHRAASPLGMPQTGPVPGAQLGAQQVPGASGPPQSFFDPTVG